MHASPANELTVVCCPASEWLDCLKLLGTQSKPKLHWIFARTTQLCEQYKWKPSFDPSIIGSLITRHIFRIAGTPNGNSHEPFTARYPITVPQQAESSHATAATTASLIHPEWYRHHNYSTVLATICAPRYFGQWQPRSSCHSDLRKHLRPNNEWIAGLINNSLITADLINLLE